MKADSSKVERNRRSQTPSAAVFKNHQTLVNLFVSSRQTHFPEALSHSAFFFKRTHEIPFFLRKSGTTPGRRKEHLPARSLFAQTQTQQSSFDLRRLLIQYACVSAVEHRLFCITRREQGEQTLCFVLAEHPSPPMTRQPSHHPSVALQRVPWQRRQLLTHLLLSPGMRARPSLLPLPPVLLQFLLTVVVVVLVVVECTLARTTPQSPRRRCRIHRHGGFYYQGNRWRYGSE